MVFEMFDDLMLLENGRVAYKGSLAQAVSFFRSLGYENPNQINPADYYLDLIMKAPVDGESWNAKWEKSEFNRSYSSALEHSKSRNVVKSPSPQPGFFTRFSVMLAYYMRYFLVEPGFFVYRVCSLIVIAIFTGTLYLHLVPHLDKVGNYAGSMVYMVVALMMTAVSPTGLYAKDRVEAVDRVANGFYTPGVFVLAQFIASAVYNWFASFVFVCIFHWLTNLNPNIECFIYDIFINWGHLMFMEAGLLNMVEVLKNDFLSTTAAMNLMGTNMLFSGFFRPTKDLPPAIQWLAYTVPMKVTHKHFSPIDVFSLLFIEFSGRLMDSRGRYLPVRHSLIQTQVLM